MTITSIGFDGPVTELQFAKLSGYLGRSPCVADAAAWKVVAVVGPDRTVRVAVGSGYADGVLDTSDTAVDVQLATIASGTRWDAIVARRDWTPTPGGGTTFTKVAGTSTQALPAGLLANPGASADQVIALAQVTAGLSAPTAVIDMRALPTTRAVTYPSILALPTTAPLGATADVAGRVYVKGASIWAPQFDGAVVAATTSGCVLPASGGTLGVTGGLTITAQPVPRVIRVSFAGLCTSMSGWLDFILRKDGVGVRYARVSGANITGAGAFTEIIPAGASTTYQLVAYSPAWAAAIPADPRFVYLIASLSS